MRVSLMMEIQEDVTWDDCAALARACEDAGLDGMFSSDHYLSVGGHRERGALDVWTVLAALATVTQRIRLGTLVSPVTFRHPSALAKSVVTVDHVSGGRVELGLGIGWHDAEHRAYGFPFPSTAERVELLAEQLEIVVRQWSEGPFDFTGARYRVEGLDALPKPVQRPRPPITVGGIGGVKTMALAARWADRYNTPYAPPARCAELRKQLDEACERSGRDPATLRLSLMTGCVIGTDEADVRRRVATHPEASAQPVDEWLAGHRDSWVVGTVEQAADRLGELGAAGVDRVMLQHHAHRDLEMVELLGEQVVPRVASA